MAINTLKSSNFLNKKAFNSYSSPKRSLTISSSNNFLEIDDFKTFLKFKSQQLINIESPQKKAFSCDRAWSEFQAFQEKTHKFEPKSNKASNFMPDYIDIKEKDEETGVSMRNSAIEALKPIKKAENYCFYAEKVSLRGAIWGLLSITPQGIEFQSIEEPRPSIKPYM